MYLNLRITKSLMGLRFLKFNLWLLEEFLRGLNCQFEINHPQTLGFRALESQWKRVLPLKIVYLSSQNQRSQMLRFVCLSFQSITPEKAQLPRFMKFPKNP